MSANIIAMYLPQYHRIPENDEWWGEGYTDWKAVKDAAPLFTGHNQPKTPLDHYYYDLSDPDAIRRQAELASEYGVYGFGIYHYWFSSEKQLLEKPAEIMLNHKDIKARFFFMWDNGSWKRTWSNVKFSNSWAPLYDQDQSGKEILAELSYGSEKDWRIHFDYLLPFFKDDRYIKIDGKPMFGVFNQDNDAQTLRKMFSFWNELARENGLEGIGILGKSNLHNELVADYIFDYEPATHGWNQKTFFNKALYRFRDNTRTKLHLLKKYKYSRIWHKILRDIDSSPNYLPGAFVRYDDTPRRGENSFIVVQESPELFEKYLTLLLQKASKNKKEFVFLTAWNEWGEGAYLEPDIKDGYAYLEAMKRAIDKCLE